MQEEAGPSSAGPSGVNGHGTPSTVAAAAAPSATAPAEPAKQAAVEATPPAAAQVCALPKLGRKHFGSACIYILFDFATGPGFSHSRSRSN